VRILVLEPYYGGSHRAVLDGLLDRLDVEYDLLTLPPRKWKWRMRGSAITMAAQARTLDQEFQADPPELPAIGSKRWDLVYASTFVNLAEFYGLAGPAVAGVPSIVYFHENQLIYPARHEEEWDYQFPLTNITSALMADLCLFNTHYNLDGFVAEIPGFIRKFPDHQPKGIAQEILAKSEVLAPPFDPAPFMNAAVMRTVRPRIVWPHRWEHDKNPESFFAAVGQLANEGLDFEIAVAGQEFRDRPAVFGLAQEALGERLVHFGEPDTPEAYAELLASSAIAVSTAHNEFFGLAMLEAAYAGCYPVVPDRLAYPEIYSGESLYRNDDQLVSLLRSLVLDPPDPGQGRDIAAAYTFDALAPLYRTVFERVANSEER
jgi:glycosyltransferase involved in cell wall biosynthesis